MPDADKPSESAVETAGKQSVPLVHVFLQLATLSSLAIAAPIFDVTARNSAFYISRGSQPADIVILALSLTLGLPAALSLGTLVARLLGVPFHGFVVSIVVGSLIGIYALQPLRLVRGITPEALLWSTVSVALAGFLLHRVWHGSRRVLVALSPLALLLPIHFLFFTDVWKLISPSVSRIERTEAPTKTPPIVFVVLDELPVTSLMDASESVDAIRFPHFAALAKDATWYRNTLTVADTTAASVPAILSGKAPEGLRVPHLADHPRNLFTVLQPWYRGVAYEAATRLAPRSMSSLPIPGLADRLGDLARDIKVIYGHAVLPDSLRVRLPALDGRWANFEDNAHSGPKNPGGATVAPHIMLRAATQAWDDAAFKRDSEGGFDEFLGQLSGGEDRPGLFYYHLMYPHHPWTFLPDGRRFRIRDLPPGLTVVETIERPGAVWTGPQSLVDHQMRAHMIQVGYADSLIGALVKRLKDAGIWNEAYVVIVSDHGIGFKAGYPRRILRPETRGEIPWVTLFVKQPNQVAGDVVDRVVSTAEIVPSIYEYLGLQVTSPTLETESLEGQFSIQSGSEGMKTFPVRDLLSQRRDVLARQAEQLLLASPDRTLFSWRGDLDSPTLAATPRAGGTAVRIDQSPFLAHVDLKESLIPCEISGRILPPGSRPSRVRLFVNRTPRATATTYFADGEERFIFLVGPDAFQQDRNTVHIEDANALVGVPFLDKSMDWFTLSEDAIRSGGTQTYRITPNAFAGHLETNVVETGITFAGGWASHVKTRRPPEVVVAFQDGSLVSAAVPDRQRLEVARVHGLPGESDYGFRLVVPPGEQGKGRMRVFALAAGEASELAWIRR